MNDFQFFFLNFAEFFRELLKVSREGFHDMFVRTYGQLYEQNAYLFTSMFDDLEKYYATGGVDLEDVMDAFFHQLYAKMFQVIFTNIPIYPFNFCFFVNAMQFY